MEVLILDENFESVILIDTFESFIWTERYSECGDFELYLPYSSNIIHNVRQGYYLWMMDSNEVMIVEEIQLSTEAEDGQHITITGRSLSSLLDRRITWKRIVLDGRLQGQVQKLLNQNVISPSDSERKIPNFVFSNSTDADILSYTIRAQYTGDNIYEILQAICDAYGLGFTVRLNSSNQFVFKLYNGTDRSYNQDERPYVIFSENYDNLISTNYLESKKTLKTITLVEGEGEGDGRRRTIVGSGTGLERRELYTDARDVQSEVDGVPIDPEEYMEMLNQRGLEKLAECPLVQSFEGEVEAERNFSYGTDYFMGDIVQIDNRVNVQETVRVTEYIRSQDSSGYKEYPTFKVYTDDMSIDEKKMYYQILLLIADYGFMDNDYNNDVHELTTADLNKIDKHGLFDEDYIPMTAATNIYDRLANMFQHIIMDEGRYYFVEDSSYDRISDNYGGELTGFVRF